MMSAAVAFPGPAPGAGGGRSRGPPRRSRRRPRGAPRGAGRSKLRRSRIVVPVSPGTLPPKASRPFRRSVVDAGDGFAYGRRHEHAHPLLALGRDAEDRGPRRRGSPGRHVRGADGRGRSSRARCAGCSSGACRAAGQLPSLRDLMERVRQRRQRELDRYDLGSALDDIQPEARDDPEDRARGHRAPARRDPRAGAAGRDSPEALRQLEEMAAQRRQTLDQLPHDPGGQIMELSKYEFMDPEAWRLFQELMQSLRQQMLKPFMQGMQQALQGMGPQDLQRLREMLKDLNRMLQDRAEGKDPNFQDFKNKWGQHFPGVREPRPAPGPDRPRRWRRCNRYSRACPPSSADSCRR